MKFKFECVNKSQNSPYLADLKISMQLKIHCLLKKVRWMLMCKWVGAALGWECKPDWSLDKLFVHQDKKSNEMLANSKGEGINSIIHLKLQVSLNHRIHSINWHHYKSINLHKFSSSGQSRLSHQSTLVLFCSRQKSTHACARSLSTGWLICTSNSNCSPKLSSSLYQSLTKF